MNLCLILLAAGDGKRLKTSVPKQYYKINGKSILEHSLNSFQNCRQIKKTILVYNKKHKKHLIKLNLKKIIKIPGGKNRKDSTFAALKKAKELNCKKVIIHDAARPNPSEKLINKIISKLKSNHAVVPIIKVSDATKRVEMNEIFNKKRYFKIFSNTARFYT